MLNEGWFRLPAKRAMLVNTRVPADYIGPEESCSSHPWYTEINLLEHYAATKQLQIQTMDEAGQPCVAEVQFQQYNAAEFYPLAILQTDQHGSVTLTTGYGDLFIHARTLDGGRVGECLVTSKQTSATLRLKPINVIQDAAPIGMEESTSVLQSSAYAYTVDWIVQPPPAPLPEAGPEVSEADRQVQEQRVREGTALRTAYEQTFLTAAEIEQYAIQWSLPVDRLSTVLHTARGNGRELVAFFEQTESAQHELVLQLLESMRPKDWQDTDRVILADHLHGVLPHLQYDELEAEQKEMLFQRYVLCPRIHMEMITPYRQYLSSRWDTALQQQFRANPQQLAEQIQREVKLLNDVDRYSGMATPAGAHRLGVADSLSRASVFVAAARTLGIAARLEPLHLLPQYWQEGSWHDASFTDEIARHSSRGVAEDAANELPVEVAVNEQQYDQQASIDDKGIASHRGYMEITAQPMDYAGHATPPAYYQDFTIALLNNGFYETLQFPYGDSTITGRMHEVLPGSYRLTSGTRLRDGSVLGRFTFFEVKPGQKVEITLQLRQAKERVPVLAEILPASIKSKWLENNSSPTGSVEASPERLTYPTVIAWLEPEREPTKHVLREFAELEQQFSERHEPMLLLLQEQAEQHMLEQNILPPQAVIQYDDHLNALHELSGTLSQVLGDQRPVVLIIDRQARIRFAVQGYKPGTASDLLQVLDALLLEE